MKAVDPEVVAAMRALGRTIAEVVPETHGFVLFAFSLGQSDHTMYISNVNRQDVARALRAVIAQLERGDN